MEKALELTVLLLNGHDQASNMDNVYFNAYELATERAMGGSQNLFQFLQL